MTEGRGLMSGTWDANIISVYAVADGGSFPLDAGAYAGLTSG
jgi:hypothetical protein